ncbi:TetR/AcrR family transcriptional regulator [Leptolyngbya sp. 15MV]|nr:TetR/AcrR family transcriptional regulator [Leptolyngbya sp. 15MV]
MSKSISITPDQLLDAAERVILERGLEALTLDAVATAAGVSKGGLLHHFPAKERLIRALVERIVDGWWSMVRSAIESADPGPGRTIRGLARCFLSNAQTWEESCRRTSLVLVAAMISNPNLVQPMRDRAAELDRMIAADGLPEGVGETVSAALDGVWFAWMFGFRRVDERFIHGLKRCVESLVGQSIDSGRVLELGSEATGERIGSRE